MTPDYDIPESCTMMTDVLQFVPRIGDEVVDVSDLANSVEVMQGQSDQLPEGGIAICTHGDIQYHLIEFAGEEFIEVMFQMDMLQYISSAINPEDVQIVNDDVDGQKAAEEILRNVDKDTMRQFRTYLYQELSDPELAISILKLDQNTVHGFLVQRKVYPDDDAFSLTEFSHTVQAVVTQGTFGHNIGINLVEGLSEVDMEAL